MPLRYDFRDGEWTFQNDELIVHVDHATYQRHIQAFMQQRGIPPPLGLHLADYERVVSKQRLTIALELRDPAYWQRVADPNVHIFPKRGVGFHLHPRKTSGA